MTPAHFKVGARVRVRTGIPFVRAGTTGTILHQYFSVVETYKVQLDGYSYARVMAGSDLAYLDGEPPV
jgi:hypothetical protein